MWNVSTLQICKYYHKSNPDSLYLNIHQIFGLNRLGQEDIVIMLQVVTYFPPNLLPDAPLMSLLIPVLVPPGPAYSGNVVFKCCDGPSFAQWLLSASAEYLNVSQTFLLSLCASASQMSISSFSLHFPSVLSPTAFTRIFFLCCHVKLSKFEENGDLLN